MENLNFIFKISKSCSTWPLADKSELIVCISLYGSAIPDWYHNIVVLVNNKRRIKRSHRSAEVDECQEKLRGSVARASVSLDEILIIYRAVTSENLNFNPIIKIFKSCSTWPLANKLELIVCISLHGSSIPVWYHNNAVYFNNKRRIKRSHRFCLYYANSVASLRIQLACSGDIEVNPGPSFVEKPISSLGQDQNERSENSANTLWLTHLNCRSLLPHIDELRLIFETNKPFLIAVTETWLRQSVYDEEISIAGFSVLRKDRKARRGGGCAVYVANGLRFKRRADLEDVPSKSCGLRQRFVVEFI